MKVKKTLAAVALMGLCTVGATFAGETQDMSEMLSNQNMVKLDKVSSFSVEQGDTAQLLVSGSDEALEGLEVYVEDNVLVIEGVKKSDLEVTLVAPELESLTVRDNSNGTVEGFDTEAFNLRVNRHSDVVVEGTMSAEKLNLYAGYGSSLSANVDAMETEFLSSTSGELNLSGQSVELTGEAMGESTTNVADFKTKNFDVESSGTSVINLELANQTTGRVYSRASGAINLEMDGQAALVLSGDGALNYDGDIDFISNHRYGQDTSLRKVEL